MKSRFIHAADIHLDSPLASLQLLDPRTAERIRQATRTGFENVVAAAIKHEVSAVLIAGDLFDVPVKDVGAAIWVESQMKKLVRASIPVVMIRGNHDALSNAGSVRCWSEGIIELPADKPDTVLLDGPRFAVHGQSFEARSVTEDLAVNYPLPVQGYFNIGLLHTSLAGDANHDTYAPTSVTVLESKGYDYWALGHIHARSEASLSDKCYIGYSGITQGRHIREPGEKGCHLVTVEDGRLEAVDFLPTDCVRWCELEVDIGSAVRVADIEDLVLDAANVACRSSGGRDLAIRVRLVGRSDLHAALMMANTHRQLQQTLANSLQDLGQVWLESLKIYSRPTANTFSDALDLPMKYIHRVTDLLRENPIARKELSESIELLMRKAQGELAEFGFPFALAEHVDAEMNRAIEAAEGLLVAKLSQGVDE